jgi:type IV pilus assembly protein PilM
MLRTGSFRGRRAVTALRNSEIRIKNIRLPHLQEPELTQTVLREASERFDFEVTGETLKYLRAGEVRQGSETQEEIILLGSAGKRIEEHLSMMEQMHLHAEHIDAEPVAMFRAFGQRVHRTAGRDTVNVVLDIGSEATRIVVARGRRIVFINSIDIAGRRMTEAVAKQLNLSFEEAIDLRAMTVKEHTPGTGEHASQGKGPSEKQMSQSVSWTLQDALRGEVEALAREIFLSLRYCSVTFRGLRAQDVTVTGGGACDPFVVGLLSERLGIECTVGRPLQGLDVSGVSPDANRRGMFPEWAVCTGLAIRGIDLSGRDIGVDHGQSRLSA